MGITGKRDPRSKAVSSRPPSETVAHPAILAGANSLYTILIIGNKMKKVLAASGYEYYTIEGVALKAVENGDVVIVRAEESQATARTMKGARKAAAGWTAKQMIREWRFFENFDFNAAVRGLVGGTIKCMSGFKELPDEVQKQLLFEESYVRKHGKMVSDNAIDHGGKGKKKAAVLPEATEDEMMWINNGKEALDIVEDPSFTRAMFGSDNYDPKAYGFKPAPRVLSDCSFPLLSPPFPAPLHCPLTHTS